MLKQDGKNNFIAFDIKGHRYEVRKWSSATSFLNKVTLAKLYGKAVSTIIENAATLMQESEGNVLDKKNLKAISKLLADLVDSIFEKSEPQELLKSFRMVLEHDPCIVRDGQQITIESSYPLGDDLPEMYMAFFKVLGFQYSNLMPGLFQKLGSSIDIETIAGKLG